MHALIKDQEIALNRFFGLYRYDVDNFEGTIMASEGSLCNKKKKSKRVKQS